MVDLSEKALALLNAYTFTGADPEAAQELIAAGLARPTIDLTPDGWDARTGPDEEPLSADDFVDMIQSDFELGGAIDQLSSWATEGESAYEGYAVDAAKVRALMATARDAAQAAQDALIAGIRSLAEQSA